MKKVVVIVVALVMMLLVNMGNHALACDIKFAITKGEKTTYTVGDTVVAKVFISFSHRNCTVTIKNTTFNTNGVNVVGATDWKETTPGTWERKIKMVVTAKGDNTINVVRTCPKSGGSATLKIATL